MYSFFYYQFVIGKTICTRSEQFAEKKKTREKNNNAESGQKCTIYNDIM